MTTPEETAALKQEILVCNGWLSSHGYFGTLRGTGGNVSVRSGDDAFLITPSSLSYDEMTPEDLCLLDFDLNVRTGTRRPSVEAGLHAAVYRKRPEIRAIVHTHQPFASVFALTNRPVPALFDEVAFKLGEQVEVIPYALSGSPELAANVAARMDNHAHAYIIQNHGALLLGADLAEAWLNAELLEKACQVYACALSTGAPVSPLPEAFQNVIRDTRRFLREEKLKALDGKRSG
ncbi:MAG TPA: class II aldolase/adducin family protein [Syntrophales bacterium]|nr:class II aldolase/adducin family protein [Syntrophales bacterium]